MSKRPDIAVCILAGGSSRRFGSHKAFAELDGKPLVVHVIDRIVPQTKGTVVINSNDLAAFHPFGLQIVPDGAWAGAGPLSGIFAALQWILSTGREQIATVAIDQPFLPEVFLAQLCQVGAPVIAKCSQRLHPINGLWSVSQLPQLRAYLETGRRDAHGWAEACRAKVAEFPMEAGATDPFLNVNTQADLAIAAQLLAQT